MAEEELPKLTEETLYCDASEVTYWSINALSIDRNSALYHKLVNDSLPFYFINPYRHTQVCLILIFTPIRLQCFP